MLPLHRKKSNVWKLKPKPQNPCLVAALLILLASLP